MGRDDQRALKYEKALGLRKDGSPGAIAAMIDEQVARVMAVADAELAALRAKIGGLADEWVEDAMGLDISCDGFDGIVNLSTRGAMLNAADDIRSTLED